MIDYNKIEILFIRLISLISGIFSANEVQEVQIFINAGEYTLAVETAIGVIVEENKLVPREVLLTMKDISENISIGQQPLLALDELLKK